MLNPRESYIERGHVLAVNSQQVGENEKSTALGETKATPFRNCIVELFCLSVRVSWGYIPKRGMAVNWSATELCSTTASNAVSQVGSDVSKLGAHRGR